VQGWLAFCLLIGCFCHVLSLHVAGLLEKLAALLQRFPGGSDIPNLVNLVFCLVIEIEKFIDL
jgi:hypothetical protein